MLLFRLVSPFLPVCLRLSSPFIRAFFVLSLLFSLHHTVEAAHRVTTLGSSLHLSAIYLPDPELTVSLIPPTATFRSTLSCLQSHSKGSPRPEAAKNRPVYDKASQFWSYT